MQSCQSPAGTHLPGLAPIDRVGSTGVAHKKEASPAGVNMRNRSIWTEAIS